LNAAAALCLVKGLSLHEGAALAAELIDSGQARGCLERWRSAARARSLSGTV
jgi:anthranilate phosphoribosyltransferase